MIIEARGDTITLRGAVTTNIWAAVQAAAALLLENHPQGIVVDCSALTEFTREGAETFEDALKYIEGHDARIILAGMPPELLAVVRAVPGVRSELPVAASIEEARASLDVGEPAVRRSRGHGAAVVPMLGDWQRAVRHAARLASRENAEIHLLGLIKVPRHLPIGTPLPDEERAVQERLQAAKAIAKEAKLQSAAHVERVRSEAAGLLEFGLRLEADFAVVSLDRIGVAEPFMDESEAMTLLQAPKFEISLLKGKPPERPRGAKLNLVVPAVGEWVHALEHACELASAQDAVVTVVCLITVPRSDDIQKPMPDEEAAASTSAAEATRICKRWGVKVNPRIERVRDPVLGFARLLDFGEFDLVLVGVGGETEREYPVAYALATTLLRQPRCETVLLRIAEKEP